MLTCFRYIITGIDYYSKWVEAKALPTKEGHGVAQFLYSLVCRHGVPNKVMSDQGREFINSVNSHLFKVIGVKHYITGISPTNQRFKGPY